MFDRRLALLGLCIMTFAGEGPLHNPEQADARAPDVYQVRFETTRGPVLLEVHREWAPLGADRFYNLVKIGYFNDVAFFRVVSGFVVQFGLNGEPSVTAAWKAHKIEDDPVTHSNTRGSLTFATSGPDSRTTQLFINTADNANLDGMGFAPLGFVVDGMDAIDALYAGYGDGRGGPNQARITARGNAYLRSEFPELDYIEKARIVE